MRSIMSLDWLPNHLLVIHVLLLFAVLNPFVIPFGTLYYFIEAGMSLCLSNLKSILTHC
jgi:hypothetical protein